MSNKKHFKEVFEGSISENFAKKSEIWLKSCLICLFFRKFLGGLIRINHCSSKVSARKIPCSFLEASNDAGYSDAIRLLIEILEHRLAECPDRQQQRLWNGRIQRMIRILER